METFRPERVTQVALSNRVVTALRRAIILGELPAGLHLEEPSLAEKFGVSRIPIREALSRLAHEGLVRLEPRRGAFVVGTTEEDIHDLYELRLLLETHAIRRVVERIAAADMARLQRHIDAMRDGLRQRQPHLIASADLSFHQEIVQIAGSRRLLVAWEPIIGLVEAMLGIADTALADMTEPVESHQVILHALAVRDRRTAERLIERHLQHAAPIVCAVMRTARAPTVVSHQSPVASAAGNGGG